MISNDLHFTRSRLNLGSGKSDNQDICALCVDSARFPFGYRADDVILRSADSGGTLKSRANSWGRATPLPPSHQRLLIPSGRHWFVKRSSEADQNGGAGQSDIPRFLAVCVPVRALLGMRIQEAVASDSASVSRNPTAVTASATWEHYC